MLALHTLPTSWATVTLTQAAHLHALGDAPIQDCLAMLLGCSTTELLTLTPHELGAALHLVLFLAEPQPDQHTFPRPTVVFIGDVEVPVLDSLEEISFGQAADIGAAIQELGKNVPALRVRVLATLLQPAYDGAPYDSDRASALEKLCGGLTLAEALPLTDFFFADFDRIRRAHAANLKKIPLSPAERSANIGQFSLEWDTLAVVDALAGGDKTKWDFFYLRSWVEVNTMIELANHQAYYRHQVHLQQERLQKR